jgi:hypothetical protein
MSKKWVRVVPDNKEAVERIAEKLEDSEKEQLQKFLDNPDLEVHDKKIIDALKKRKLLNVVSLKSYTIKKGPNF